MDLTEEINQDFHIKEGGATKHKNL